MDWFLYDNDLRHERVKLSFFKFMKSKLLSNYGTSEIFSNTREKLPIHLL